MKGSSKNWRAYEGEYGVDRGKWGVSTFTTLQKKTAMTHSHNLCKVQSCIDTCICKDSQHTGTEYSST